MCLVLEGEIGATTSSASLLELDDDAQEEARINNDQLQQPEEDDVTASEHLQQLLPTEEQVGSPSCSGASIDADKIENLLQEMSLKMDEALNNSNTSAHVPSARVSLSESSVMLNERVTSSGAVVSERNRIVRGVSSDDVSVKHVDV